MQVIFTGHVASIPKATVVFNIFQPTQNQFCLRLSLGPRLPRQNAAAFGSREGWRQNGRAAAPRGQSSRGLEGQIGPWPRTRIGGKPPVAQDYCEEVGELLMVQAFWWIWILVWDFTQSNSQNCFSALLCWRDIFYLSSLLWLFFKRLPQSKIEFKFPSLFNEPWHPDFASPIVWNV